MIKRKMKLAVCVKCGKSDGHYIPADAYEVKCFACASPETKPEKFTGKKPE